MVMVLLRKPDDAYSSVQWGKTSSLSSKRHPSFQNRNFLFKCPRSSTIRASFWGAAALEVTGPLIEPAPNFDGLIATRTDDRLTVRGDRHSRHRTEMAR